MTSWTSQTPRAADAAKLKINSEMVEPHASNPFKIVIFLTSLLSAFALKSGGMTSKNSTSSSSDDTEVTEVCLVINKCQEKCLRDYLDKNDIIPHSAEGHQNVAFLDQEEGHGAELWSELDPIREAGMTNDTSLDEFFSRPIKVASSLWLGDVLTTGVIDPWTAYFQNKRVINRLTNFKLLQCKLHVKFVINGTPFHYGRVMANYIPLYLWDNMSDVGTKASLTQSSQRPKVFLNPTTSQGADMVLPFFWYKNSLDIPNQEWKMMGAVVLEVLNELKQSNGGADVVDISTFVWATDVKLAVPTQYDPAEIVPQAKDEYSDTEGMISKPAGIISIAAAGVAAVTGAYPPISAFALSTSQMFGKLSGMAKIMGYSKPPMLSHSVYRPIFKHGFATTDTDDDLLKLSLDAKQETTIDPRVAGLGGEDEMTIASIASRESYIDSFVWPENSASETLLWNCIVDPGLYAIDTDNGTYHTACSFAVQPFKYWRGSMKFRFQVVASMYHRGRIKIVYDPQGTVGSTAEYNTVYTTIVDITDTADFEIVVGWGSATTYRKPIPNNTPTSLMYDKLPLDFYESSLDDFGNGTIAVYVVNELCVPDTTVNNDIEINVFVKAGDNFEVAMPTGESVTRMRLGTGASPYPAESEVPFTYGKEVPAITSVQQYKEWKECRVPQPKRPPRFPTRGSSPDTPPRSPLMRQSPLSVQPHSAPGLDRVDPEMDLVDSAGIVDTVGIIAPLNDPTNHVYFGEVVRSFRAILKRYNRSESIPMKNVKPFNGQRIQRNAFPIWPGYTTPTTNQYPPTTTLVSGEYFYGMTTMLNYVSSAFAGRKGAVRVFIDLSGLECCSQTSSLTATRYSACQPQNKNIEISNIENPLGRSEMITFLDDFTAQEGATPTSIGVNPSVSIEVPYYSPYRFTPSRQPAGFGSQGMFNTPCWKLGGVFKPSTASLIDISYSAGEDFSCFFFVGAPKVWTENIPPT